MLRTLSIFAAATLLSGASAVHAQSAPTTAQQLKPELAYQLTEGLNINYFLREGPVAAHLLLRNGNAPRILVAFPAGNSGVGLWFNSVEAPATWSLVSAPQPVTIEDSKRRSLHGLKTIVNITASRLSIRQAVLSNVRFLRDFEAIAKVPEEILIPKQISGDRIIYARDRIDGAPGQRLELRVIHGRIDGENIVAGNDGKIGLEIIAANGDAPLTGLTQSELLNERAAPDQEARNALAFLSYREKYMAGSWRFNTYFGRDTLMSLRLLMPALKPDAVEAGLGAVLARMNADGEVAHEEGLSEFAIVDRRKAASKESGVAEDAPTLDYAMIDDDFMLAPVMSNYLLEHAGAERAKAFLAESVTNVDRPSDKQTTGALLVRNLRFVMKEAHAFADKPAPTSLVAIKAGRLTGQWRDSEDGLGHGRYAYDVNAVFVPAALESADTLLKAGLLDPYLSASERQEFTKAAAMAKIWRQRVPGLFHISIPADQAKNRISAYAQSLGVAPAVAAQSFTAPLAFHAIALDDAGKPIPIMHSDEGFALLFGNPSAKDLDTYVPPLAQPFPSGLMTDIGMLVANAAQADKVQQDRFSPAAYHGAVVWSWQQALMAAGLERQLARKDLPAKTRANLAAAQRTLWKAINATAETRNSELWSWAYEGGAYKVVAFGAGKKDVDESNAAQLWSTVFLAVRPPQD